MHEQEIKLGYKMMLSEARLENFGDNNVKKIQNIHKIRGVKGSILPTFSPKGGTEPPGPPGYGPEERKYTLTYNREITHTGVNIL